MHHEMLIQRAPFCIGAMAKKGTLSQHFVTHVVPPLGRVLIKPGMGNEEMRNGEMRKWGNEEKADISHSRSRFTGGKGRSSGTPSGRQ